MSYVVYHRETTRYLRYWLLDNNLPHRCIKDGTFEGLRHAKAALTKAVNLFHLNRDDFDIAPRDTFEQEIEKKEERHGIVGSAGKVFVVGVNTPWTSGPWSETYWSS